MNNKIDKRYFKTINTDNTFVSEYDKCPMCGSLNTETDVGTNKVKCLKCDHEDDHKKFLCLPESV